MVQYGGRKMYIRTTRIQLNIRLARLVFLVTAKISSRMRAKQTEVAGANQRKRRSVEGRRLPFPPLNRRKMGKNLPNHGQQCDHHHLPVARQEEDPKICGQETLRKIEQRRDGPHLQPSARETLVDEADLDPISRTSTLSTCLPGSRRG